MDYIYRDLIKEPLEKQELQRLAQAGGMTIKEMVNTKSQSFKKVKPDLAAMDEDQVAELIGREPRILKRPMIADRQGLLLGFSEASYQERLG